MGKTRLRELVTEACSENSIKGLGPNDHMVLHGVRGSVSTMLITSVIPDSAITMRTGHLQLDSLRSYQNIRGKEGDVQQHAIFGGSNPGNRKRDFEDYTNGDRCDQQDNVHVTNALLTDSVKDTAPIKDENGTPTSAPAPSEDQSIIDASKWSVINSLNISGSVVFNVYNTK